MNLCLYHIESKATTMHTK